MSAPLVASLALTTRTAWVAQSTSSATPGATGFVVPTTKVLAIGSLTARDPRIDGSLSFL